MKYDEYKKAEAERLQANIERMEAGVEFVDINMAYIDETVVIEPGAIIANNVTLRGSTVIGAGAYIGQSSVLKDAIIGENAKVEASYITESSVGARTTVGPFAYIRPGSKIGEDCKIGDYVEVKNSTFGDGSKASHLTYIGDADVGKNVNLGCGVVFVNYDGSKKYRSTVGDDAFIGCNSNLVSPVNIGEGVYIAAATTITEDVPADALCVGRSKQVIKENWVTKRKILKKDL